MSGVADRVGARIAELIGPDPVSGLGVAVSGGSDSLALMLCAAKWAASRDIAFRAVTIDHGLRAEAAREAGEVAAIARAHGIAHDIVPWGGWTGQGNLQDQARQARYALISDWAHGVGIRHVALGHTADDQAETLLMRLARGAGVDGLSAIPEQRLFQGVTFLRPLLDIGRGELRDWLAAQGQDWIDDPSNEDARFDRVKARQALDVLAPLGIGRAQLAVVAANMAEARKALNWYVYLAAREIARLESGDVVIALEGFRALPEEIKRRMLAHALCWISGAPYPPRRRPLVDLVNKALNGEGATLHGCRLLPGRDEIRLTREFNAVAGLRSEVGTTWDGRWRFAGPAGDGGLEIAALGEAGLSQCPDWRETGMPRASLLACPAVWRGDRVVAAPLAGLANGWRQVLARDEEEFLSALMMR